MCFVAGTPVLARIDGHPQHIGIEKLEQLAQAGHHVEVMSRDEQTAAQNWKPVLNYFTTHPSELVHLTYETSDGRCETLSGTHEHPFYVSNRAEPGFVAMGDLVPGDFLYLSNGHQANVKGLTRERAPPGELFNTYNFEVADFHTYFVGTQAVWVHNSAASYCQKVISYFLVQRTKHQGKIWDAFDDTIRHINNPTSRYPNAQVLNQKAFNEARRLHFAEGSTEAGPWLNPRRPQLVGNPKTSARLAENLQRAYGYDKIPYGPAHHIIPKGEPAFQPLRDILDRFDIDLDDCSNGTFMTTNQVKTKFGDWADDLGHIHQNHPTTSPYLTRMLADLNGFALLDPTPANTDKLKNALQKIAAQLADGSYPWP